MKKIRRPTKLALNGETLRKLDDRMLTNAVGAVSGLVCISERAGQSCTPNYSDNC